MNSKEITAILNKYQGDPSFIIAILQDIQARERYLAREVLEDVAQQLAIPLSKIYYLSTFYRAFSLEPRGVHLINVCVGTACHVRGAQKLVDALESDLGISARGTTADHNFSLETVNCLGTCALGPVVVVDGEYHGQVTSEQIDEILRNYRKTSSKKAKASTGRATDKKRKKVRTFKASHKVKTGKKKRGR